MVVVVSVSSFDDPSFVVDTDQVFLVEVEHREVIPLVHGHDTKLDLDAVLLFIFCLTRNAGPVLDAMRREVLPAECALVIHRFTSL